MEGRGRVARPAAVFVGTDMSMGVVGPWDLLQHNVTNPSHALADHVAVYDMA